MCRNEISHSEMQEVQEELKEKIYPCKEDDENT